MKPSGVSSDVVKTAGRRSPRTVLSVLIAVVAVTTAVVGVTWHLSSSVQDAGPLGDGGGLFGKSSTCLSADPQFRAIAIGYAGASNTSSNDVVIDRMDVSDLQNIKVLGGAQVVPFIRNPRDGVQYGQVHSGGSFTPSGYKDSQPLIGAKIPPAARPKDALLYTFGFAVQRMHAGPASFGDVTVLYHTADGQRFRTQVGNGTTRLADRCS